MTRTPLHTVDSAPEASRPMLEAILAGRGSVGRILNLQGQLAHAPATLSAYIAIRKSIEEHATLDLKTRFAVQLTVAGVQRRDYSLAINTMLATRAGWTDDEVEALQSGVFAAETKLGALLAVVREAAANTGAVDDATWAEALRAGWTDEQLIEAFACIALTVFVDYFVAYADTPIDVPTDRIRA
jgi:alkylhydroperoxidase family enzyme